MVARPPVAASSRGSTASSPRPCRSSPVTSRPRRSTRTPAAWTPPTPPRTARSCAGARRSWSRAPTKRCAVRTPHVLAPAFMQAGPATAAADAAPLAVPAAPVQRRPPPDGYRCAIEVHRQPVRPSGVGPAIAEAMGRQTAVMRELSHRAFPEPDIVADNVPASVEATRARRRHQAAVARAAALLRARQERAARECGAPADVLRSTTVPEPAGPCHRAVRAASGGAGVAGAGAK